MGHCLKEQIYQMSGLASEVLCGYSFPVALWTCKAKSPITSESPPLWGLWSLAKQPHHWTSSWALPYCSWTAFQEGIYDAQSRDQKTRSHAHSKKAVEPWKCLEEPLGMNRDRSCCLHGPCIPSSGKAAFLFLGASSLPSLYFCWNAVL